MEGGRVDRQGEGRERMGRREGRRRQGDPLTVMQLLRGNLTAISCHTRKPRVAGKGQPEGECTEEEEGGEGGRERIQIRRREESEKGR